MPPHAFSEKLVKHFIERPKSPPLDTIVEVNEAMPTDLS